MTAALIFAACELETSEAGALDGMWHLTNVDTLATDGTADLSQQRIYWAFQGSLMNVSDKDNNSNGFLLRYNHTGDSLTVSEPYINDRDSGDIKVEDAIQLAPYGISALTESYFVERLNSGRMFLKSKTLRLKFIKF